MSLFKGNVCGIFLLQKIYTKTKIIIRKIILWLFLIIILQFLLAIIRGLPLPWWGIGIFAVVVLIWLSSIISIYKKKPGVYIVGFLFKEHTVKYAKLYLTLSDLSYVIKEQNRIKRKRFLGSHGNQYRVIENEIVYEEIIEEDQEVQFNGQQNASLIFSIAQQDPGQQRLSAGVTTAWHFTRFELMENNERVSWFITPPSGLCVIKDKKIIFHFQDDEADEGEKVFFQLKMLGDLMEKFGTMNRKYITLKIIPYKSSISSAAALGLIGVGGALLRDELKKKKLLKQIKSGKFSIINRRADLLLLHLLDELNWDITV